jgi:hypothetical protein
MIATSIEKKRKETQTIKVNLEKIVNNKVFCEEQHRTNTKESLPHLK